MSETIANDLPIFDQFWLWNKFLGIKTSKKIPATINGDDFVISYSLGSMQSDLSLNFNPAKMEFRFVVQLHKKSGKAETKIAPPKRWSHC